MRFISLLLILALIFISGFSCKKPIKSKEPTPYTLKIPSHFPPMDIPEDNPMTVEGVELGRKLFWDTKLSGNNTISCGTCHSPKVAFSDTNQFSQGISGALGDRNSMALINLGWQQFFFWDGRAATLEDQIFQPVTNPAEMDDTWSNVVSKLLQDSDYPSLFEGAFGEQGIDSVKVSKAIAQFLRTMISGNSDFDVMYQFEYGAPPSQEIIDKYVEISLEARLGYNLFNDETGNCFHCHGGVLAQTLIFSNNGLDLIPLDSGRSKITKSNFDYGKFKVPTLRNVALSFPYMHDGRFNSLDEVIDHYSDFVEFNSPNIDPNMFENHNGQNPNQLGLNTQEKAYIKALLESMTDWEFINNPDFQDPN